MDTYIEKQHTHHPCLERIQGSRPNTTVRKEKGKIGSSPKPPKLAPNAHKPAALSKSSVLQSCLAQVIIFFQEQTEPADVT